MDVLLGLDTSCYTTSAAAVDMAGEVVAFSRLLLPVESGQRGLRQSEAVFAHVRQFADVMKTLNKQMPENARIVGVCASATPRDEEGSYMPVFRVGAGYGQALADTLRVPFFTTSPAGEERSGMGFCVMQAFMDQVQVTSAPGQGTQVTLKKSIATPARANAATKIL